MDNYFVCRVAIAPLRAAPSDRSEIVSQLLFGDRVTLLEKDNRWWKVKSSHDQYEAWMDFKQLEKLSAKQFDDEDGFRFLSPQQVENLLIDEDGTNYYLAAGSILPFYDEGICYLGLRSFQVRFKPVLPNAANFNELILSTAKFYQNAPYLWGGRTLFGIDCSGFSQSVYRLLGIQLKRDASQQAEQGHLVDFLAAAQLGDLAFFDNDEGKITHVGIMLNNHQIIHASGKVKIDPIDDQGIYSTELGRYTHHLRIIKRFH